MITEQSTRIDQLLGFATNTSHKLDITYEKLVDTEENNVVLQDKLIVMQDDITILKESNEKIIAKLDLACVMRVPNKPDKFSQYLLICRKPNTLEYALKTGQYNYIQKCLKDLRNKGYTNMVYYVIDPNPIDTRKRIMEKMPDNIGTPKGVKYIIAQSHNDLINYVTSKDKDRRIIA